MRRGVLILLSAWMLIGCTKASEVQPITPVSDVMATTDIAGEVSATPADAQDEDSNVPLDVAIGEFLPDDCGVPTFHSGSALRRYPYLQSVHHHTARVVWTTTVDTPSTLEYRRRQGATEWLALPSDIEAFPASRTGDVVDYWAHHVGLQQLEMGTEYCYRIRQGASVLAEGLQFTSAWDDAERPLRILAFGDSGTGSVEQKAVRDAFMVRDFDVFLHLGDMAYGDGTFVEFENHVFDIYQDLLHKTPTWPTIGNHEYRTDAGQPYLDVYYLPEQAPRPEEQERYYSFDYGEVHLVSVDSNESAVVLAGLYGVAGEDNMLEWLRQDLAKTDKRWKIAFFHHPPYSSSERGPNILIREQIVPILEEHNVDLVLSGHDHHTERTKPLWKGAVSERGDALTYIVAGAAGAGLRDATGDWFTAAVDDQSHAFVSITIQGCELKGETINIAGESLDTFTISKCE